MVENTDGSSYMESFKPELDDPDCCGGLSSSIIAEMNIFVRVSFFLSLSSSAKNIVKETVIK